MKNNKILGIMNYVMLGIGLIGFLCTTLYIMTTNSLSLTSWAFFGMFVGTLMSNVITMLVLCCVEQNEVNKKLEELAD